MDRERGGLRYVIIEMVTNILLKPKINLHIIAFQFLTHSYVDSLALAQKSFSYLKKRLKLFLSRIFLSSIVLNRRSKTT